MESSNTHPLGPGTVNRSVNLPLAADRALGRVAFQLGVSRGRVLRDALRGYAVSEKGRVGPAGVRERRRLASALRDLAASLPVIAVTCVLTWASIFEADRLDVRRVRTGVRVVRVQMKEG